MSNSEEKVREMKFRSWRQLKSKQNDKFLFKFEIDETFGYKFDWTDGVHLFQEELGPDQVRLGSVADPVIQATGSSEFEDGLGSGDFVSGYSYHMSVCTGLPDHTMQTKFQSQRPSDVETPVPSILSTEVKQHLLGGNV
jgi:hypothetical protein